MKTYLTTLHRKVIAASSKDVKERLVSIEEDPREESKNEISSLNSIENPTKRDYRVLSMNLEGLESLDANVLNMNVDEIEDLVSRYNKDKEINTLL